LPPLPPDALPTGNGSEQATDAEWVFGSAPTTPAEAVAEQLLRDAREHYAQLHAEAVAAGTPPPPLDSDLIERYVQNKVTPAERRQVFDWSLIFRATWGEAVERAYLRSFAQEN
jgi:hypothetical protein